MMKKIGFLGLGVMGLPMAINLVKKSKHTVLGYDVFEDRTQMLAAQGGIPEKDPIIIFKQCDIIFLCMPTNELLTENVEAILKHAKPGTIIIDLGSTSPNIIRRLYTTALQKNIHLVDSPVSGGEIGAINASLVLMCGGDKLIFDQIAPLLACIGSKVTYMGNSGCGSIAKLANNMIVICNMSAMGEAFAFAVKAGLDPTTLFNAIKDGFAGSAIMDIKMPKILKRDFSASARVAVHMKDIKNATQLAQEMGVKIPLSEKVLTDMKELEKRGLINDDHCSVVRIYEHDMGVEIK